MQEYLSSKSYIKWNKYSKDRFKFGLIVTNTKGELSHLMDMVFEIMEECVKKEKDFEIRYVYNLFNFIFEELIC